MLGEIDGCGTSLAPHLTYRCAEFFALDPGQLADELLFRKEIVEGCEATVAMAAGLVDEPGVLHAIVDQLHCIAATHATQALGELQARAARGAAALMDQPEESHHAVR